jgi:hypothetical protein
VRLRTLRTSATNWPIAPLPDDDDDECGAIGGMRIGRGNRSARRKLTPVPRCPPQLKWLEEMVSDMGHAILIF